MKRSRRLLGSAAAGFTAACLLAPAAAYTSADDEPVELATDVGSAPAVEPGLHTMNMPDSTDTAYFAVERTIDDSTIWVGESLIAPKPVDGSWYITPTADGTNQDCGQGAYADSYYGRHDLIAGSASTNQSCSTADKVLFGLQSWDPTTVPNAEANLVVWEEPPVADASILPPPATNQKWVGTPSTDKGDATLGHTFADAPELVDGKWKVHVDPGKAALFKVPLDWNQHLQVWLTYDGPETVDNVTVRPILINPVGGKSAWGTATQGAKGEPPGFDDIDLKYNTLDGGVVSPSITWRNREAEGVTAAFPGTYYVLLQLGQQDIQPSGADFMVDTKVITDKAATSPYAQDAEPVAALDGSDAAQEESDEKKSEASSSSSDETPWAAVGGLFAGSAVMAAAGVIALGRHRRSRA
ncbi:MULTISPECIES: hypothetical protein [unclassified Nocardioides]|uniref:hypothetical protein n=1 Tax=unclassified Nocardioides TaxID=2615069 RepID=UPI0006F26EDE|nr:MULTISPECIES: hypothetical protein [unclassified Nocardioides]KQY57402.1 hypothetical protein ASD30_14440 [Nocardioides sp. Root140]KRF20408.1 hypothetical protein ASH02_22125 [Nocardioides sp. Soil796]